MIGTNAIVKTVCSDLKFLCQTARRQGGTLLSDTLGISLCTSALHMVQLATVPMAVGVIMSMIPLWWMAMTATALCGLTVLERTVADRFEQSRDAFRSRGCTALARRAVTYIGPSGTDALFAKRMRAACDAMGKHIYAPLPHIWYTLSQLTVHTVGLLVTAVILVRVSMVTAAVVALTALLEAVVHRTVTVIGAREAQAEGNADERLAFLSTAARSSAYAKDIRVFGLDAWIRDLFDRSMRAVEAMAYRRAKVYAWFSVADALLTAVRGGVALAMTASAVSKGVLSLPVWLLWLLCVGGCAQSIGGLLANGAALCRELPAISAYRRCLEEVDSFVTDGGAKPMAGPFHTLELRRVSVASPHDGQPLLREMSLTLHEGERLAVVGEDGAWKEALLSVICGLCDPTEGAVLLDGVDVRKLDRRAYYALISAVFPNADLPEMTVREMLTSAVSVDEESLWKVLENVGLAFKIREWPCGLDTSIGRASEDGVGLSGGEKTRLLLARALCKNGDILVLDEPTAALDPLAEHALYQQYDRLTAGKGALFVSHRAALSRCCDRIVYIKNGTLVEEGTHETLLARGGEYAALFELQSRYYREGRDPAWR